MHEYINTLICISTFICITTSMFRCLAKMCASLKVLSTYKKVVTVMSPPKLMDLTSANSMLIAIKSTVI